MIRFMNQPFSNEEIDAVLDPDVRDWFKNKYKDFSPPQKYSVKLIHENKNVLISSPTGTGKTLSAFLSIINKLVKYAKEGKLENRVYAIYISPLRALGNDIKVNLDEPFKEITALIEARNHPMQEIRHAVRSGDTTAYQKQKMNTITPHILITTPESLALMLSSTKFVEKIKNVENLIIDEIHALCENKRGTHLSLSLERLENMCKKPFSRTGLSATISPMKDIAQYLVGYKNSESRECKVVEISYSKDRDLRVFAPVKDPVYTEVEKANKALYKILRSIIEKNKTTLIFTNTRAGTESVVLSLQHLFASDWENVEDKIVAHHSSLSKEQRVWVEEHLKAGQARVVVSSTSLELGIDIGSIGTVVQIGSPKSIARCLQRVGRAGHNLEAKTIGHFVCPDSDDLLEVGVMLKKSYEGKVDSVIMPRACLDVLAQHLMGMALEQRWNVDAAFELIKRAAPYHDLKREDFDNTLEFLNGTNKNLEEARVYGKIWYDKETKEFGKRGKLARLIYMSNIGTIPDEAKVTVVTSDKKNIGYVDEGFLERLKKGDIFILGGRCYMFKSAAGMKMRVETVINASPTVPNWFSEQLPLSFDLAADIRLVRERVINAFKNKKSQREILDLLEEMPIDENAAEVLYEYFKQQYLYLKRLAGDFNFNKNTWLIEYYNSREGYRIIFHTLYGRRVNDALARIYAVQLGKKLKKNIALSITDNGFMVHLPKELKFDPNILKNIDAEEILKEALDSTEILRRRFRHVAARGLMILKRYKGYQMRVGRQQITATTLLKVVREENAFPLLKETYREILEDYLDLRNLNKVLEDYNNNKIHFLEINVDVPTPFAHSMVLAGMSDIVLAADKKAVLRELREAVQSKIGKLR